MMINAVVYVMLIVSGVLGTAIAWDDLIKDVERKDADSTTNQ